MDKINFQNLPNTTTPVNAYNLNKIQENAENAINEVDNKTVYSTSETIVGEWLGKPLYRKVININNLPNNTYKAVAHNISNIEYVTKLYLAVTSRN